MGNSQSSYRQHESEGTNEFRATITTGSYKGQTVRDKFGVSSGHIRLRLYDADGVRKSDTAKSRGHFFKPGTTRKMKVRNTCVAEVGHVEVWVERKGQKTDLSWFVETVEVEKVPRDEREGTMVTMFPFHRMITMNKKMIKTCDSVLPQDDSYPVRRKEELVGLKKDYIFSHRAANCIPVKIDLQATSELFSKDYFVNVFLKKGIKNTINEHLIPHFTRSWTSLQRIDNIYNKCLLYFRKPLSVKEYLHAFKRKNWSKLDELFAEQRLIGTNPLTIRRVKSFQEIKDKIRIDEGTHLPYMDDDGKTVGEAISNGRLYAVDYTSILSDLSCANGVLAAPIALFFETNDKKLMPVAIQLFKPHQLCSDGGRVEEGCTPGKDCDNPVFIPYVPNSDNDDRKSDGKSAGYTWFLAKMWFNNADASYHQSICHLGFTHLLMETMYLALRQKVSLSHPLHRLMAPHFFYTLQINKQAWDLLINEGGWVDTSMTIGIKGMFEIIRRRYEGCEGSEPWCLDREGNLEKDLEDRDVGDLPGYWFRDDAKELHKIIKEYVKEVVQNCYKYNEGTESEAESNLEADHEIQAWAKMLKQEVNKVETTSGGCGVKGIPADENGVGHFSKLQDVEDVITSVIYTCSVGHAAVNFKQYDEYGFPLCYPSLLHGGPPRDTEPLSEKDILQALPTKRQTLAAMNVTSILSQRGAQPLGQFEIEYQYDDAGKEAVKTFKKKVGDFRGKSEKYNILDPTQIPNSISI